MCNTPVIPCPGITTSARLNRKGTFKWHQVSRKRNGCQLQVPFGQQLGPSKPIPQWRFDVALQLQINGGGEGGVMYQKGKGLRGGSRSSGAGY